VGGGYYGGGMRGGSFGSVAPSHAFSGGQFGRAGTGMGYGGHFGNGYGGYGNRYGGYFGRGRFGGYGGWGWGDYGLGWGLGWGLDLGYPYDYGYGYDYPDAGGYYYTYAPSDYVDSGVTAPQQFADSSEIAPTTTSEPQPGADEALDFYSQARAAFLQGDYKNALRLGGHAAVDAPRNPKVHELISLSLFALGKYAPAASEGHAAMALGTIADWNDLYGYYNDVNKYMIQLRALENAAKSNPTDAADHFLLAYHYLMTGHRDEAKTEIADAVKLTPKDQLASHYLQELQSNAPLTPPAVAARPQSKTL
jgi:tetratricopeptide (TPR) repeat protein